MQLVVGLHKDYKHGSVKKEMTLDALEFIHRFSLHILPKGFVRIRHYGILSSSAKEKSASLINAHVPTLKQPSATTGKTSPELFNPKQCPCCKKETMETVMRFNRRGPPPSRLKTSYKNIIAIPIIVG